MSGITDKTESPRPLTPAEVAARFGVDVQTVTRWADDGKLSSFRTLGGHRRYDADEVERLLNEDPPDDD